MKYIIITGAGNGLGFETAKFLSKKGFFIFGLDIDVDGLQKLNNNNILPITVDVTNQTSIDIACDLIKSKTSVIECIFNFAGIMYLDSLIEGSQSRFEKIININLFGTYRINKTFFTLLVKKSKIINVSSELGWISSPPFVAPYSISKYALEAYNDSLRREMNYLGIKVIKLQLGSFKTNMHNNSIKSYDKLLKTTKLYKNNLIKMKKLMSNELKHGNDIKHLLKVIEKIVYLENPKHNYRIKNSRKLMLLNSLPKKIIDKIYVNFT